MNTKRLIRIVSCLAILAGFFLPWIHGYKGLSGLDLLTTGGLWEGGDMSFLRYALVLLPILSLIILFITLSKKPTSRLLRSSAFIIMIIYAVFFQFAASTLDADIPSDSRSNLFQFAGIGFYISLIGSFLLLFAKDEAIAGSK